MTDLTPRREATVGRLVKAAIAQFAARGIDATSVENLCEAAGFSRGAFYSNFTSKDGLCVAVAERYRDDVQARGLSMRMQPTRIDFDVNGRDIVLVDDILHTGRTIRAALNEIFDYGRPARVRLAVLIDRGERELPVQPDHVGTRLVLQPGEKLALSQRTNGMFELRVETVQA